MPTRAKVRSQVKRRMDECLTILLDEIQLATIWSRPSILLAIHRSKTDQEQAMIVMERRLHDLSIETTQIVPEGEQANILQHIANRPNKHRVVFFVHTLGNQLMLYDGLNLYRELIVEQNLRVIFWLTTEEAVLLSQRSPDLWAFRHHTVEFNSSRSSVRNVLPSGALLWQASNGKLNLEEIREKIAAQEKLLQTISETGETLTTHTQVVVQLAYLHWLAGENAEVTRLVEHELQKTALANMDDIHALVCNAQAINCYDQKQYKDALQWIEKALEANPNLSLLWSNHGLICRSAGQSRKSFSSIKKAVRLNPSAPENWEMLGYIYASVGKFAAALSAFEQAQTLRSDKDHLNPILAFCHHRIGNLGKFRRLVQLITDTSGDNEYLIICRDGLREDKSAALKRLGAWAQEEKIPQALIRRDVQLHFILGIPS